MASNYAKRMAFLSARIFGEVARPTNSPSMKVVKILKDEPLHMRDELVNYYPRHCAIAVLMNKLRYHGLYRDEHQDFKEEMDRLRALRGKAKRTRKHPPRS